MQRILFCWELGQGYGHVAGFLPLALKLRERGYEVVFVLKDLLHADTLLRRDRFSLVQAPIWQHPPAGMPEPVSYAELLFRFGYLDAGKLYSMVSAWRELYRLLKPALLIVDHGPTALLAARGLDLPVTTIGHGFFSPPRLTPLPSFRPWQKLHPKRLMNGERRVLGSVNEVIRRLDLSGLECLAGLFDVVDEDLLCTLPELEHYPERKGADYWGPRFDRDSGKEYDWPNGDGAKIFAYLKPNHPEFNGLVARLCKSSHRVILHAPGLSQRNWKGPQSDNVLLAEQPVNLRTAASECDLAICHASHGTVAAVLLAGRPLLMMPAQLEQQLVAMQITQLGAALTALPGKKTDYLGLIKRLYEEPGFRESAQQFAVKYADFNEPDQFERMLRRWQELIDGLA